MRAIPTAAPATVRLVRGEEEFFVEMAPVPVGYGSTLDKVYPPPLTNLSGKMGQDEAAMPEYTELKGLVLLAASIRGDYALSAAAPTDGKRASWHAYALAVRQEFVDAGFVTGDIVALFRGYQHANSGRVDVGKAPLSETQG